MPTYEYDCQGKCGRIEIEKRMSAPSPVRCPHCYARLERVYSMAFLGACDAGQEAENNGFGKFYPQAGPQFLDAKTKRIRNPAAHARSRYDMIEKLKRRGAQVDKT